MADIDYQKEKVSFWRMFFFFWLTTIIGLIAFLFNNFDKLSEIKLILINITLVILIIFLLLTSIKLKKETEKLKDL